MMNKSAEMIKTVPYKATLHFNNEAQRKYQYEKTREEVIGFSTECNIEIPTYEQAVMMWDSK